MIAEVNTRQLFVANADKQEYYADTMRMVDRAIENVAMQIDIYKREQRLQAAVTKACLRLHEVLRESDDKEATANLSACLELRSMIYYALGNPYTKLGISQRKFSASLLKKAMEQPGWNEELDTLHTKDCQIVDSIIALRTPPSEFDEPTAPHADAQHTDILANILPSRPPAI